MAGKINEKVRVIHKPDGNIVWENACGTAKNAGDKDEKVLDGVKSEAKVLYRQLADIARKFDALDQKARKGGWYYADWKDMAKWVRDLLDGKTY